MFRIRPAAFSAALFVVASSLHFAAPLEARDFSVLAYNVENFFDADGKAAFDDYLPPHYTPAHVLTKVHNITRVVSQVDGGKGPDIILFEEIELDQTPSKTRPGTADAKAAPGAAITDVTAKLIEPYAKTTIGAMLGSQFNDAIADLPSEALLLKAFNDAGLTGYHCVPADQQASADGEHLIAQKVVIFSRFPVREAHTLRNTGARDSLEIVVDVDGAPLHVIANHWKSGAGDPATEQVRIGNARVLRDRLDAIFKADPHADVIIGGDFNSQYNQRERYHDTMPQTAIDGVLRAQGDEAAMESDHGPDLYNLWYDLPVAQRGSDVFRGEWGTLMQLIISRGLYDCSGVQYIDGSFAPLAVRGLNADGAGAPVRWDFDGHGSGFSDHLPILARFRTVTENHPEKWLTLAHPGLASTGVADAKPRRVEYTAAVLRDMAITAKKLPAGANLRDGSWSGKLFLVDGKISDKRFSVEAFGDTYEVFAPDPAVRELFWKSRKAGDAVHFFGELTLYKNRWEFVIKEPSWITAE